MRNKSYYQNIFAKYQQPKKKTTCFKFMIKSNLFILLNIKNSLQNLYIFGYTRREYF